MKTMRIAAAAAAMAVSAATTAAVPATDSECTARIHEHRAQALYLNAKVDQAAWALGRTTEQRCRTAEDFVLHLQSMEEQIGQACYRTAVADEPGIERMHGQMAAEAMSQHSTCPVATGG